MFQKSLALRPCVIVFLIDSAVLKMLSSTTLTSMTFLETVPSMSLRLESCDLFLRMVFTAPDWRRAEGRLRTTAAFVLTELNAQVDGLELELSDGEIKGVRAERGEAAVRKQLESVSAGHCVMWSSTSMRALPSSLMHSRLSSIAVCLLKP